MQVTNIRIEGLRTYLERTRDTHNRRGYADLAHYIAEADELNEREDVAKLCRAFNVSRPTMYKWIAIYREEQAHVSKEVS